MPTKAKGNQVRAFASLTKPQFNNNGEYLLTYQVVYVNISSPSVQDATVVVNCNLKDGVDLLRSKIADEIRNHGTTLGLDVVNNGVIAQDFFKG